MKQRDKLESQLLKGQYHQENQEKEINQIRERGTNYGLF